MSELEAITINSIIENRHIKSVFQPIISLKSGHILGYEALSRITIECTIKSPEELFVLAESSNCLWDLELICRTIAIESSNHILQEPSQVKLFLNVNPSVMQDVKFRQGFTKEFIKQFNIPASNIIFEITERNVINDIKGFKDSITHYKNQGFQIAIDDAGSGYAGLNLISDINPDYIKLDINLIRDIDKDNLKYALVKSMVEFSRISNIKLIAEGIETQSECETLIKLGVQFGQGYFIQRPNEFFIDLKHIQCVVEEINQKNNYGNHYGVGSTYISHLCSKTTSVDPNEKTISVYHRIKSNESKIGFCVVENEVPIGIVTKGDLALKLSGNYGFTLFSNHTIRDLMKTDFMVVEAIMPIEQVSNLAMNRNSEELYDFIVVVQEGKYLGTVTVKDLLQKTTELQIISAKQQNPLTGLPGNQLIEQKMMACIQNDKPYTIIYCDIDHFKVYNDIYGFENGDLIIKMLSDVLRELTKFSDFVGHIGGDDFVVILEQYVESDFCELLSHTFVSRISQFYNELDLSKGYVISTNREGETKQFPLLSLTSVMVNNRNRIFNNHYEISQILANLKKQEKQKKSFYSNVE